MPFTGAVGVPAPAVAIGMGGLIFPLWAIGAAIFLGYEFTPAEGKALGATCLVGCYSLSFQGLWHIVANPLGGVFSIIFALIPFMYSVTWLVGFFVNVFGFDGKVLGQVCLQEMIPQIIASVACWQAGGTQPMLQIDLWFYILVLFGFFLFTHGYGGKGGAYYCGIFCFLSWIATVHLMFWWSGIYDPGPFW